PSSSTGSSASPSPASAPSFTTAAWPRRPGTGSSPTANPPPPPTGGRAPPEVARCCGPPSPSRRSPSPPTSITTGRGTGAPCRDSIRSTRPRSRRISCAAAICGGAGPRQGRCTDRRLESVVVSDSPAASGPVAADARVGRLRLVAVVTGLLGTLCFLALPFLPVSQTTSTVQWPQNGSLNSVAAPLMAHSPQQFTATVPCGLVDDLPPEGGVLLSTAPPGGEEASDRALFVTATEDTVDVVSRNRVIVSAPREEIAGGGCSQLSVTAAPTYVEADFEGGDGAANRVDRADLRPMVVGVYTDLSADTAVPDGLDVTVDVDSRFTTDPTLIKWAAIVIGLLSTAVALWALHGLDQTDGRRSRRFLPRGWFRLRPPDFAVLGTLGLWHFIGGNPSDDGYILTMARAADPAGYMANYYRWYGVPESPFGSPYYDLLTLFSHVSTASPWMRLPALIAAVLCWMIISREVLPRLGRAARATPVVVWSAAAVFLAFWVAFNNGLRPEPAIALGALLTWTSVERAIATRRLLPFAVAVIVASFSLATGPTGLMAVAAL